MASPPPRSTIPRLADLPLLVRTERLALRPFVPADVEEIWPYVSDPEFPRMMSWEAHADRRETAEFIDGLAKALAGNSGIAWAIEHEGRARGCISLESIRWRMRAWRVDRAELGYWLVPSLWNQGLMTEAARAALRYGFDTIGLHKISVGCLAENDGSRRVIEKVGFRYIGRLEDDVWRDGQWRAHLRYELTCEEFARSGHPGACVVENPT
jgi:[ribosomal protein S5]-alanine N-acetyltransferase